MQHVGRHLQIEALRAKESDKDAFARSAYNRYYYASFLLTRDMIRRLYPDKTRDLGHAAYPGFLSNTVAKDFKRALTRARKNGDRDLVDILRRGQAAARSLASQFEASNSIRTTADYHPETPVAFEAARRFSLNNLSITEADAWAKKTEIYIRLIEEARRQIDG